jgi:hypothetical protein
MDMRFSKRSSCFLRSFFMIVSLFLVYVGMFERTFWFLFCQIDHCHESWWWSIWLEGVRVCHVMFLLVGVLEVNIADVRATAVNGANINLEHDGTTGYKARTTGRISTAAGGAGLPRGLDAR